MKVDFKKLTKNKKEFSLEYSKEGSSLVFSGTFFKNIYGLMEIEGRIKGTLNRSCDVCGEDASQVIDESVVLYASDTFYNSETFLDVIEFLEGQADFEEIFEGEVESLKTLYFRCENCNKIN